MDPDGLEPSSPALRVIPLDLQQTMEDQAPTSLKLLDSVWHAAVHASGLVKEAHFGHAGIIGQGQIALPSAQLPA